MIDHLARYRNLNFSLRFLRGLNFLSGTYLKSIMVLNYGLVWSWRPEAVGLRLRLRLMSEAGDMKPEASSWKPETRCLRLKAWGLRLGEQMNRQTDGWMDKIYKIYKIYRKKKQYGMTSLFPCWSLAWFWMILLNGSKAALKEMMSCKTLETWGWKLDLGNLRLKTWGYIPEAGDH